jgi:hypothetical protein
MSKTSESETNVAKITEYCEAHEIALQTAVGYDDCIVGVTCPSGFGEGDSEPRVVYNRRKIIDKLMSEDGMDEEEAEEFFSFNIIGSYVGKQTPVYIDLL